MAPLFLFHAFFYDPKGMDWVGGKTQHLNQFLIFTVL